MVVLTLAACTDPATVPTEPNLAKGGGSGGGSTGSYELLTSGTIAEDVNATGQAVGLRTPGVCASYWDAAGNLIPLPVPAGYCGGAIYGISESGYMAGRLYDGGGAVRWVPTGSGYTIELLGPGPNGGTVYVWDVNDQGDVLADEYVDHDSPMVWSPATGWVLLAMPPGATWCAAHAMSNAGAVVAHCGIGSAWAPVYWPDATAAPVVLPCLSGGCASTWNVAEGINPAGTVIVGTSPAPAGRKGDLQSNAVRWTLVGGAWQIEALSSLGGAARAFDADDAGNIVGWSDVNGVHKPVVWEGGTTVKTLGAPKNSEGLAIGISATGRWVVGYFSTSGLTAARWRF
jgi:uncharacterized membrane protein